MIDRDAPLRMPQARTSVRSLDPREVRRQLGLSLWLVGVLGVALTSVALARPAPVGAPPVLVASAEAPAIVVASR